MNSPHPTPTSRRGLIAAIVIAVLVLMVLLHLSGLVSPDAS